MTGKSLSKPQKEELAEQALSYLRQYREDDVVAYAKAPNDAGAFTVDWKELYLHDADLAEDLLEDPVIMGAFEDALEMYDLPVPISDPTVRLTNVGDECTMEVYELRKEEIGKMVTINGQVAQLSGNKIELEIAMFECQRCGTATDVAQADHSDFQEPYECPGCERQGPFRVLHDQSVPRDFQMARLEIPPELATDGDGQTLDVLLYNDLVGGLEVGDRVEVIGKVILKEEKEGRHDMLLRSHGLDAKEGNYEALDVDDYRQEIQELSQRDDLYDALAESLAPHIVGGERMRNIKLALMLAAFGTETRPHPGGTGQMRGTPHILLLGDPGVGKSELLDALETVSPRSVFASGDNSTGAGLTAAAVRDDFGPGGEWTVRAGALPRAHKGLACIDEIDKADDQTLSTMHTALEKLVVKLDKAGLNASLPSQTTLLAAGNPKHGRFDRYEPIGDQIDLEPAIMSRFDLMFMMEDIPDQEKDEMVAQKTVEAFRDSARAAKSAMDANSEEIGGEIDPDLLTAYIAYAQENVLPELTETAMDRLTDFYVQVRQANGGDSESPVPVTARKLESGIRLTEASARARLSEEATLKDAERAIDLIRMSMEDVGKDPETGNYDVDAVEVGETRTQHQRREDLKSLIREVDDNHDGPGAPVGDLMQRAEKNHMDLAKVEDDLEHFRKQGHAYEPQSDRIKLMT